MKLSKVLLGLSGCFFAASLSGCFVVASDPSPTTGSVSVELSLDGSAAASECDYFHVDGFEVQIFDTAGLVTSADGNCVDMRMTIDAVPPGRYTVKSSLLDVNDRVVSDVIAVDNILVTSNTDSVIPINFPAKWIH